MPLSSVVGAQSIVKPGVCTSTTKPASPFDGQVIYMTDVDQTAVWDGTQWTVLAPIAGGRNRIINGAFNVWQRGAGAFTTSNTYTADRWAVVGASGQTISVTQQSFTPGNAISGFEPTFFARIAWSGTPSGTFWFTQRVEDVRIFAGQQVVLSFWAKASASTSVFAPVIEQNFGTGGSSVVTTTTSAITLTTSWQRFSIPISVPSISGKTIGTNSYLDVRPLNGGSTVNGINIDIWGVQLEAGAVATPFEFEDYGTTLAKCQRYYEKTYDIGTAPGTATFNGIFTAGMTTNTSNNIIVPIRFKVEKRTAPTMTAYRPSDGVAGSWGYSRSGATSSNTVTFDLLASTGCRSYFDAGAAWVPAVPECHWVASAEL
jgi:hypothetical protein